MRSACWNVCLVLAAMATLAVVGERVQAARPEAGSKGKPASEKVELFAAMKADQIEVKLVPKDATQSTVIIRNKTDKPLSIRLPDAFVGRPILAQDGGDGGGGRNNNSSSSSNSNQSMGGGMGGMGMGGMGMGGGFLDAGADRAGKFKVPTVCLEHGKADPNPRVPYEIAPIAEFTQDAALVEVCQMLGREELDQKTAQAAAWHLSDKLSWQELAAKIGVKHLNGSVEAFFQPQHVQGAVQAVQVAHQRAAKKQADEASPGEKADAEAAALSNKTAGQR